MEISADHSGDPIQRNLSSQLKVMRSLVMKWSQSATDIFHAFRKGVGFKDYQDNPTRRKHTVTYAAILESYTYEFGKRVLDKEIIEALTTSLLSARPAKHGGWSSDPTYAPNVYETARVISGLRAANCGRFVKKGDIQVLTNYIKRYTITPTSTSNCPYHPFLLFISTKALNYKERENITIILRDHFYSELYRQLSHHSAGDVATLEPIRIAWCLAGLYELGDELRGYILQHAFDVFMRAQDASGTWPLPGAVLRINKDNIITSPIEVLTILLQKVPKSWISPHMDRIERLIGWVESHRSSKAPYAWVGDNGDAPLWFNILVLTLADTITILFKSMIADASLRSFLSYNKPLKVSWGALLDTGYKKALQKAIIDPLRAGLQPTALSAIMFGPPGTAKTTIAKALAKEIDWPFVELTPADFCLDGQDKIFRHTKDIFERLLDLQNVVVLFDEIDELVAAREQEQDKLGRFITTAMLPWFQKLRDAAQIIFLVNTNHIKRYDKAISRPGRFDLILPVGPLSSAHAARLLSDVLKCSKATALKLAKLFSKPITIGELLALCTALSNRPATAYKEATRSWLAKHPPVISKEEHDTFVSEINSFSRI